MAPLTAEGAIDKVGGLGWYQLRLFLLLSYMGIWTGSVLMVMTFSTAEPPWQCVANNTACNITGLLKPGDANYKFRCGVDRSSWEFVAEDGFDSIVTEWDLVCDKAMYASIANSMTFVLWIFSAIFASILSDKFGRKKIFFPFAIFACICGLISAFARKYWVFVLFRSLLGAGVGAQSVSKFVFLLEYIGVRHRSTIGIAIWYPWIFSLWLLALLGYLIPNWRTLSIITSAPGLLFVLCWWFFPESLRFYLVKGKFAEARKTLVEIAKRNGKNLSANDFEFEDETSSKDKVEKLGDIRDLFRTRAMVHRTLVSCYGWAVCASTYYGTTLSSTTIGGNMYLNFFLTAVFEGIGMTIAIPMLNKFGRKKSIVAGLCLAAVAAFVAALLSLYDDGSTAMLVGKIISVMVIAKFAITIAYDGIYVYSSELFPTVVRNTAMGLSTSAARIGSFCAPYVLYTQQIHPLMPFGILGINALICCILCMTLPETNKKPLTEHVREIVDAPCKDDVEIEENRNENKEDEKLLTTPSTGHVSTV